MQTLGRLKDTVALWRDLESRGRNLLELTELAMAEDDLSLEDQLEAETGELSRLLAREEINLTLSGPYDHRPAIVSIHAGAGGTDSQDWAEILLAMYTRWAETGRRPVEVLDLSYGDEAGLRSGVLEVGGAHAYGSLTAEQGVHRLVRLSPYDPNRLRHTSFARVEVLPTAEEEADLIIRAEDLKMDTLPFQRPRRPERAEGGVGGAAHPPAHRNRRVLPDRAFPAPKPGVRDAHPPGKAAETAKRRAGRGDREAAR